MEAGLMEKIIFSMGAGSINDFIRDDGDDYMFEEYIEDWCSIA